jgi:hypothetical protein
MVVQPISVCAPALQPGMLHLIGALPQLLAYNNTGFTLYALTVYGANRGTLGAASLAGPAVSADGVTDWPEEAKRAAEELFSRPAPQRAGAAVVVVLTVQVGRASHCTLIRLPRLRSPPPPAAVPHLSCAASGC